MLASLLPGLRQVRAPLSAGFLWLVAIWFLLEPRWPEAEQAGVFGSANRLMATISVLGQGVVLSFVAYLLGSFSVFLFTRPLLRTITTSREPRGGSLTGLSPLARLSLGQVATDGRQRLEQALSLSGTGVDEVLGLSAPAVDTSSKRAPAARRHRGDAPWGPSADWVLPPPEERQEAEIADRVLRDLPVIANAQLLGQHPEVFSAVDRIESEVEFRIALVPALAAFAVSVAIGAAPGQPVLAVAAVILGGLAALGLLLDAARRRRDANELVLSLMEHGRIVPPSVLRAESAARGMADQAPAMVVARQAQGTSRAIRRYLAALDAVPSSGSYPMLTQAHDASRSAHEEGERLERLLRQYQPTTSRRRTVDEVLVPLDRALSGWTAMNASITVPDPAVPTADPAAGWPDPEELVRLIRRGRELFGELVDGTREIVSRIAAGDAARAAVPEGVSSRAADGAEILLPGNEDPPLRRPAAP